MSKHWDGFEDLPEGGMTPGEGGELTPEMIDKINNAVTKDELDGKLKDFEGDKDLVFKMSAPLKIGPQIDTEIHYPYKGKSNYATISLSSDSIMKSNILLNIEKYNPLTKSWDILGNIINMTLGVKLIKQDIIGTLNENDKLRINIVEGNLYEIKDLTLILNITNNKN